MIGIIGCGASGMLAAIMAAREGASVTVFEHNEKAGRKLLATGNGKCNLTNDDQKLSNFRGGDRDAIETILASFTEQDELDFFRGIGILTKEKRGYRYPHSEQAASVVNVLTAELRRLRVRILYGADVTGITAENGGFRISYTCGSEKCNTVVSSCILASGGPAGERLGESDEGFRMLRNLSVSVGRYVPALVPLMTDNKHAKTVSGVRLEAGVTLTVSENEKTYTYKERGEIVFTDYGVSGIPVMQLSRFASVALDRGESAKIALDFMPEYTKEEVIAEITKRSGGHFSHCTVEEALEGLVPCKLRYVLLLRAGIDPLKPATALTGKEIEALVREYTEMTMKVTGTRPFANAQVTCGGVDLKEIDPSGCEVKKLPGLYVTGELLDMDGNCGGYNLQWAFATGAIAGRAAAKREKAQ
ncbi:MAG: NAD(P)/FAD-dependent oxidoreductase [Lachnospiraceae bacterium]|nr:NAD(P)/FAD-dependent oxidoreductase [Lachnospiraceae bacterium]